MRTELPGIVLLLFIFFVPFMSYGQFNETIRTGRPGQAIGPFTVGKNVLQLQQGIDYVSVDDIYDVRSFISNNVIRFGTSETFELSALIDYQFDKTTIDNNEIKQNGLSNLHLGFRVHLSEQKGLLPATGFQMRLKIPNISKEFGNEYIAPAMVLITNWSLAKNYGLGANWILSYSGNDAIPTGKYIVNFGFPIHNNLSGFLENYGQIKETNFETRFDSGFAYLINNNCQIDLSFGYGSNHQVTDYFVSAGVSWRILSWRK